MNAISQQQHRVSSFQSVTTASVTHEETTKTQIVHAGFTSGSPLPAVRNPGYRAGIVLGFVAYTETKTTYRVTTSSSFSVSQALPKARNPVDDLFDHTKGVATHTFFQQTTTYQEVRTTRVFYFFLVIGQSQAPKRPVPPALPAQTPKQPAVRNEPAVHAAPSFTPPAVEAPPAAKVSLNPVGRSKTSVHPSWEDVSHAEKGYRYDVWIAGKRGSHINVTLKSPRHTLNLRARQIADDGLSFTGVDSLGNVRTIQFSDVANLKVSSA